MSVVAFEILAPVVLDSPITRLFFNQNSSKPISERRGPFFCLSAQPKTVSNTKTLHTMKGAKLLDILSIKRRHIQWCMKMKGHLITTNSSFTYSSLSLTADTSNQALGHIKKTNVALDSFDVLDDLQVYLLMHLQ